MIRRCRSSPFTLVSTEEAAAIVYPSDVDLSVIHSWILYCLGVDGRDAGDGAAPAPTSP